MEGEPCELFVHAFGDSSTMSTVSSFSTYDSHYIASCVSDWLSTRLSEAVSVLIKSYVVLRGVGFTHANHPTRSVTHTPLDNLPIRFLTCPSQAPKREGPAINALLARCANSSRDQQFDSCPLILAVRHISCTHYTLRRVSARSSTAALH